MNGEPKVVSQESDARARERLAWEAERLAEAEADLAAGRVVASERVDAWIESLGTERELPPPQSGS